MYAQVEKPKTKQSRAVVNFVTQKKTNEKQGFGVVNNGLKRNLQSKLQGEDNPFSQAIQRNKTFCLANHIDSENQPIQRLIIRARDLGEMIKGGLNNNWKNRGTIYSSTTDVKNRADIQNDLASPQKNDDIGIGQINNNHRNLTASEPVIVVAHGGEPKRKYGFLGGEITNKFAQRTTQELSAVINRIAPVGYS